MFDPGPYIAVFTPVPAIDHPLGGRSRFQLPRGPGYRDRRSDAQ
jgi:hypothetical protein